MKKLLLVLLLMAIGAGCAHAHTREDVRAAWRAIEPAEAAAPFVETPRISAPYAPGVLSEDARREALDALNFIRWLAGLDPVRESIIYDDQCQRAAVLLAALDYVDHDAPRPADMDRDFYDAAHLGTSSGNIARFNWMRSGILRDGVEYFVRDDGDVNLGVLGHRRWVLDPCMAATGFGLANAASGMSYVVMYACDLGAPASRRDWVGWPAPGAFPAELMHDHLAWSVSLDPDVYDLSASRPRVTLCEPALGLRFEFDPRSGTGDGFCAVSDEAFGVGSCLIFRPDFSGTGFADYQQNQHWSVRIDGLKDRSGGDAALTYDTDMVSLRVQDPANIEISALEAALHAGESLALSADVIPAYADDLRVSWSSTDPGVATVDAHGRVTAIAPGRCEIVCADCMGHTDACALTVSG